MMSLEEFEERYVDEHIEYEWCDILEAYEDYKAGYGDFLRDQRGNR